MKILAFTDIHGSATAIGKIRQAVNLHNPDLLVCAGDISMFERNLAGIMGKLNRLQKRLLIINGNHENARLLAKTAADLNNIKVIHKRHFIFGDAIFFGYGGGGFSMTDRGFEKASKRFENTIAKNSDKKAVLITHAPPYKTRLDKLQGGHCGNKSIRRFIEKNGISLAICGHLHENFKKKDFIGKVMVVNPGPFGKIIDL